MTDDSPTDSETATGVEGIVAFKSRPLDMSKPVKAYLNLHKRVASGKPWYSLMQEGRVVAHADRLVLCDARFEVQEQGRQRVLKEQRKNAHAWVWGLVAEDQAQVAPAGAGHVTYNPYTHEQFELEGHPILFADIVVFEGPELWAWRS